MTTDTTALADHLATMLDVAPRDWWRFVGCGYCMARRGEGCVQGYDGWPNPAREPHAVRRRAAQTLRATIWLLANHPGDVLGESADSEGAGGVVSDAQVSPRVVVPESGVQGVRGADERADQ